MARYVSFRDFDWLLLVFVLGVWIPAPLMTLLRDASALLEVPQ